MIQQVLNDAYFSGKASTLYQITETFGDAAYVAP